jgi:small ligand-binding sensory domain FIST
VIVGSLDESGHVHDAARRSPEYSASAVPLSSVDIATLFSGGEIGPVGGEAFLDGLTATRATFLEP